MSSTTDRYLDRFTQKKAKERTTVSEEHYQPSKTWFDPMHSSPKKPVDSQTPEKITQIELRLVSFEDKLSTFSRVFQAALSLTENQELENAKMTKEIKTLSQKVDNISITLEQSKRLESKSGRLSNASRKSREEELDDYSKEQNGTRNSQKMQEKVESVLKKAMEFEEELHKHYQELQIDFKEDFEALEEKIERIYEEIEDQKSKNKFGSLPDKTLKTLRDEINLKITVLLPLPRYKGLS